MIRRVDVVLGILVVVASLTAARRWRAAVPPRVHSTSPLTTPPAFRARPDADALERQADATIERNPFRLGRAPSDIAFEPASRRAAIAQAPPQPRPSLVLRGLVGGPPWMAIVDGLPGQPPATLVREGAAFDKLLVRQVTKDTVVIQGADTTWRLTLSRTRP